jgi:hypothetical protein
MGLPPLIFLKFVPAPASTRSLLNHGGSAQYLPVINAWHLVGVRRVPLFDIRLSMCEIYIRSSAEQAKNAAISFSFFIGGVCFPRSHRETVALLTPIFIANCC